MIDVIIPAYNAHNTIEKTLASIAYQINVNELKVYIVNDASETDYSKEISFFSNFMNIKEISLFKNCGPGKARQIGIDSSNSKYIVFIDADDVFSNPYSLTTLYNSMEESNADIVISNFYELLDDSSKTEHKSDVIWLHGKMYRRSFLNNANIRFNNTRKNEDNGFNQLVLLHDSKVEYIDDFTYIWMYNKNSITRINDYEYQYNGIEWYLYNISWALNIAIKDNCDYQKISELAYSTLLSAYYYYIMFIEKKVSKKFVKKSIELYKIHLKYPLDSDDTKQRLDYEELMLFSPSIDIQKLLNPPIGFNEFINLIESEGNLK